MTKINIEILDEIAQLEARTLLEGLKDPILSKTPQFLDKVRKFLKDNNLIVTPETDESVEEVQKIATEIIPIFKDEVKVI